MEGSPRELRPEIISVPATIRPEVGAPRPEPISISVQQDHVTGGAAVFDLRQPALLMGRDSRCAICLDHPDVSAKHLYLQHLPQGWHWYDLSSRTGVWINGARHSRGWFDVPAPLAIGPYRISRNASRRTELTEREAATSLDRLPRVRLEFLNGQLARGNSRMLTIRRAITFVGSTRQCKVRLQGEAVSRIHCSLVRTPDGLWVVDLLGRSGTRVDGRRVAGASLCDGSELAVGEFRMLVHVDNRSHDPDPADGYPSKRRRVRKRRGHSDEFVLSLVDQMLEMQNQYFEQSQQLMSLMHAMITQPSAARQVLTAGPGASIEPVRLLTTESNAGSIHPQTDGQQKDNGTAAEKVGYDEAIGRTPQALGSSDGTAGALPVNTGARLEAAGVSAECVLPDSRPKQLASSSLVGEPKEPVGSLAQDKATDLPSNADPAELHASLLERMEALQKERSGKLARITNLLTQFIQ